MKSVPHVVLKEIAPARAPTRSARRIDDLPPRAGLPDAFASAAPSVGVKVSVVQEALTLAQARDMRREDPSVKAVAPVMQMKLIEPVGQPRMSPSNDRGHASAGASGKAVAWGVKAVGADSDDGYTGRGITVAVLDTGIDATHPAFAGIEIVPRNFTDEADQDEHGHGTHCAGTIFGRDVDGKRIGVARGVAKAVVGKILGAGGGGSDKIVEAIQWAVQEGADVISMSLGIDFPGYVKKLVEVNKISPDAATSAALEGYRANVALFERLAALLSVQAAFGRTALLVAAAGNESKRPAYEIAASPPAVAPGFVCVAAASLEDRGYGIAPFSNTGAAISGPGVDIESAKVGGGFALMSGTSMATPHVAGVAALWAEQLRARGGPFDPARLGRALLSSARPGDFQPGLGYDQIGEGMAQAPTAAPA